MRTEQMGANTSCLAGMSLENAVDTIRRLGFHGITLLAFPGTRHEFGDLAGFWFRDLSVPEREKLKGLVDGFDTIAIHAPFADLPLFTYDPRLAELSWDRVREAIDAASYLGAGVVTVHANHRPNWAAPEYWEDMVTTFRALGQYAADRGVRIGLETGFPDSVEMFVDLLEAIGHHGVGATLDCGHMLRYVDRELWGIPLGAAELNDKLIDMARQLGVQILQCHLHDVDPSTWRDHRGLGRGIIDFGRFLAELDAIGYEGMLEIELEEPNGAAVLEESRDELESLIRRVERLPRPGWRRAA